ncbi:MAG TPA: Do family serine endopeptidase [Bacteroidales bacterium]|nr:Do family serine endopeptidase [Bacteroidales bacterium]HPT09851.1 Do family serine endopeptidase [Bacteroidales bacterium]
MERRTLKRAAGMLLIAMVGGAVTLGMYKIFEDKQSFSADRPGGIPIRQVSYNPSASFNQPDFEAAAEISVHAVVHIKSEFQKKSLVYDDFFEFFNFGGRSQPREYISPYSAMGSGVIVAPDGYIVTNNHVVQEATAITVTLNDKREYKARIIGSDPSSDLALIKIDEKDLPFLSYGNSDEVRLGEWVLAVGNPFNLTSTVTAGIVSAKARNINILGSKGAIESFIQTDAAINPGNSGGALVNTRGELIGINAAIASGTGYYTGYSFAIPVNIVKKVVADFVKFGKIQRAYLGVYYREIDDQFAKDKGFSDLRGVYIDEIVEGGPADQAGIKKGDVIITIDNSPVNGKSELMEVIGQKNPGDKVDVVVHRDGKELTLPVTLVSEDRGQSIAGTDKLIIHGAVFQALTDEERAKLDVDYGFKIVKLDEGKLKNSGIRVGFIVLAIDRKPVTTADDLREALSGRNGGVLIEGVYPNGLRAYYGIGL